MRDQSDVQTMGGASSTGAVEPEEVLFRKEGERTWGPILAAIEKHNEQGWTGHQIECSLDR